MADDFYERASRDLPNFPRDVIHQWFEHAESGGWPPQLDAAGFPVGQWAKVLGVRRSFAFWRTVTWRLEGVPISLASLEPDSGGIVNSAGVVSGMMMAYRLGLPGGVPNLTTADYRARMDGFLAILRTSGRMPRPPILLRDGPWFEVLDGTHRLAALFVAPTNAIPLEPAHDVWIATAPGS